MAEAREVNLGDYVIRLDDRVVELLHRSGIDIRIHVNHIAVEAQKAEDGGIEMHVGVEAGGKIQQGARLKIPAERANEVIDLFEAAKELRDE